MSLAIRVPLRRRDGRPFRAINGMDDAWTSQFFLLSEETGLTWNWRIQMDTKYAHDEARSMNSEPHSNSYSFPPGSGPLRGNEECISKLHNKLTWCPYSPIQNDLPARKYNYGTTKSDEAVWKSFFNGFPLSSTSTRTLNFTFSPFLTDLPNVRPSPNKSDSLLVGPRPTH